jgi:hypothetical protein
LEQLLTDTIDAKVRKIFRKNQAALDFYFADGDDTTARYVSKRPFVKHDETVEAASLNKSQFNKYIYSLGRRKKKKSKKSKAASNRETFQGGESTGSLQAENPSFQEKSMILIVFTFLNHNMSHTIFSINVDFDDRNSRSFRIAKR